LEFF
jgi:acetylglutamate kinase